MFKNMFSRHVKLASKFKSQKRFLSESDKQSLGVTRANEAKGAMKDFIQKTATGTKEGGLWSRLRQDIAPPPVVETAQVVSTGSRDSSDRDAPYQKREPQSMFKERKANFSNGPKRSDSPNKRPVQSSSDAPEFSGGGAGFARREKRQMEEEEAYLRGETFRDDDEERDFLRHLHTSDQNDEDDANFDINSAGLEPEDFDMIFDSKKMTEDIRSGRRTVDVGEMDELDVFMATAYSESFKTESGVYQEVTSEKKVKKVKLPKPRSMSQMVYSMKSNIRGAEIGSAGYVLGEQAWNVVSKNFYYDENQKYLVVDHIAEKQNNLTAYLAQTLPLRVVEDVPYPPVEYDGIFQFGFRKGLTYMEEEEDRKAMRQDVAVVNPYIQTATDWDVEAVEDEDQL